MNKPPKQVRRWLKKAGLRSTYGSHNDRGICRHYFNGVGHGRHWRFTCDGRLDMSEPFDQFDRWANSVEESEPMNCRTEAEFVALVRRMRGDV